MNKKLLICSTAFFTLCAPIATAQTLGETIVTESGKYEIIGKNLFENGDFSNGTQGWTDDMNAALSEENFTVVTTGSPTDGPYLHSITSSTFHKAATLDGNGLYLVGYYAKSGSGANQSMTTAYIYQDDEGSPDLYEDGLITSNCTYTTDWTRQNYIFNGKKTYVNVLIEKTYTNADFANFFVCKVKEVANTETLQALLTEAQAYLDNALYVGGKDDLRDAIEAASDVLSSTDVEAVNSGIKTLQNAIKAYIDNNTIDCTSLLKNPDFSIDANNATAITGWTNTGFKQNKRTTSYTSNSGRTVNYFLEQWNAKSLANQSGNIYQDVAELPAGHYRITADAMACLQSDAGVTVEGAELYIGNAATPVATGNGEFKEFTAETDLTEGETLRLGFRFPTTFNGNWLALDNVQLAYIGDTLAFRNAVDNKTLITTKKSLTQLVDSAEQLHADPLYPIGNILLQDSIDLYKPALAGSDLPLLTQAVASMQKAIKDFYATNAHYTAVRDELAAAKAKLADETYTEGKAELQDAIDDIEAILPTIQDGDAGAVVAAMTALDELLAQLKTAENTFGVANASYAHPINIITNGDMSSINGWDILNGGTANPALHINSSGNVTEFSKPFMECWVSSANSAGYGQENYARQTIANLPDGSPLPSGYYILKASALATQQNDASVEVTGVTLYIDDQDVSVATANGVGKNYSLGKVFDNPASIEFGLHIDAATTANWIAWDNVELQYVGDYDKYRADYIAANLKDVIGYLKAEIEKAEALKESADLASAPDMALDDFEEALTSAKDAIEYATTAEEVTDAIAELKEAEENFRMSGISPVKGQYFDYTGLITNPNFDTEATDGWLTDESAGYQLPAGTDCPYWWFGSSGPSSLVQDFYQELTNLPKGNYQLDVVATVRCGMTFTLDAYTGDAAATYIEAEVYANDSAVAVKPALYDPSLMELTNDYDFRHGSGTFITGLLKGGAFHNIVNFTISDEDEGTAKIGFRCEAKAKNGSMPFIDSFALRFYGNQDITGIRNITHAANANANALQGVYSITGQRIRSSQSLEGLPKGIYIVGGKKYNVK